MSAVLDHKASVPTPWRTAAPAVAAAVVAVLLLYRDSFAGMVEIWSRSDTYAHAWLVPPIVAWLVWRKRAELAAVQPRPLPWLLLPLLLAGAAWLLGDLGRVNALTHAAAVALLVLVVPLVLGARVARVLAFPLLFAFFMVPVGDFLLPLFMEWTADFTVFAVAASGVPVYREGLQFIIPSGSWSVVEACSGVRYLIASLMVGTLFAYLNYRSWQRRLAFCLVALVLPIVANWLRAYMIVMIGHLSGNTLAVGVDHLIYGWLFFGVVIGLMFFIGARWADAPVGTAGATQPRPATAAAPGAGRQPLVAALAAAAVLALPPLAAWRAEASIATAPVALALPELAPAPTEPVAELTPVFVGAAAQAQASFAAQDGMGVAVHVAYYRRQGREGKLISSVNVLVRSDDHRWNPVAQRIDAIPVGADTLQLRRTTLASTGLAGSSATQRRLEVAQVYWIDDRFTASPRTGALLGVLGRLAGRGDDAAMVTFVTDATVDPAAARARLDRFIARHLSAIRSRLQATAAAR
jgi:exosortase A